MNTILMVAAAIALVVLLASRFNRGLKVKPLVIKSPRLGVLNLKGEVVRQLITEDTSAVSASFSVMTESSSTAPKCDVLILY